MTDAAPQARRRPARFMLLAIQLTVLSTMTLLLVRGDGPGSGRVLAAIDDTHGINSGDVPVLVLWVIGTWTAVLAYRRG